MTAHDDARITARPPAFAERDRAVARVLWGILALNLGVAAIKFAVSWKTGTVALFADAIHAVLDGASNVVGLVGLAAATKPADEEHPYGHRRFETIAAMGIGIFIASGLVGVLHAIFVALFEHRAPPVVTWSSTGLVAFTVAVNLFITRYEKRRGIELQSALLTADASHTLSDTFGALTVLGSFVGIALGIRFADIIAAVVVAILIAKTAYGVLSENLGVLTDQARLDAAKVRAVALEIEGVRGAHKVRSRGAAESAHVDLHIHVDPLMSVEASHALTHRVVDAIRAAFPGVADVVIHTEPADGREHADPTSHRPDA